MMVLAHLRRRQCLSGSEGFGVFEEIKCLFSIALEIEKWWKHKSVSWAKTCALMIHIWRVAHKWQGRSNGTRKRRSVTEIHTKDAWAGSNRHWRQRLSGYPSSAYARGRDRRAVAKATDVTSRTIPVSDAVELRGRMRAWATDARRHVCRPCGVRVWWTRAKTSSLGHVCWAYGRVCRPASDASVATVHDRWFSNVLDTWHHMERRTRHRLSPPNFAQWSV
jgi:hypothetical protein